jgi:hypothetical protein
MASLWFKLFFLSLATFMPSTDVMGQGKTPLSTLQPGDIVCCIDATGQRACGNVLQRECVGRAYTIYNKMGLRIREIAAPMTAEEKQQIAEQKRRKEQEKALVRDKQRQDNALLRTYDSLEAIDRRQTETEADIKKEIALAEAKIAEADKRLQNLRETADRYSSTTLPPDVATSLRNEDMEIKYQSELIKLKQRELIQAQQKFTEDRRRYNELTRSN